MTDNKQRIVFFDGVCNLCNASVQTILKNDKQQLFYFASLQSEFAGQFFLEHQYQAPTATIIYFDGEMFYHKTGAVLRIARKLRFPFPLLYGLIIFPPFIRNGVYDFIAKYRYAWFGKTESCMMPKPQWKQRFLG